MEFQELSSSTKTRACLEKTSILPTILSELNRLICYHSDLCRGTIHDTADPKKVHSKIKGYWTSYLEFDGRRYWDLEKIDPVTVIHTADPMPSDCRFREDLIWLAKKDQSKSQE